MFNKKSLLIISLSLSLVACGGGGSSPDPLPQDPTPTPAPEINNEAPVLTGKSLSVDFNQPFTFFLNATDSDNNALSYTVTQQAATGKIALNSVTGELTFTPQNNQLNDDSFTVQVDDGKFTSSASYDVSIVDASAPQEILLTQTKVHPVSGNMQLAFDDLIKLDSITVHAIDGSCSGAIQFSADNFLSCIPLTLIATDSQQVAIDGFVQNITLQQSSLLTSNTLYQVKLNAQIENYHGITMQPQSIAYQTASTHLIINEVSASEYTNDRRWIELYNGTENAVNLADYRILSQGIHLATDETIDLHSFYLPNQMLPSGNYLIIQAPEKTDSWQSDAINSEQLVVLDDASYAPYWSKSGFIELIDSTNQATIDFVRFGYNSQTPQSAAHWPDSFSAPSLTGKSLNRSKTHQDTNMANEDWQISQFATPAGINDVNDCTRDDDADGIPDCAELNAESRFAGLPLYNLGARTDQKDIFIEVDYMQSSDLGIIPQKEALQKVKDAFANKGYQVHFDAGNLYHPAVGISQEDFDLGGGNEVPYAQAVEFKKSNGISSILDYKSQHMDLRRRQVFFYMLFANSQERDGSRGSSGLAEINGNDSIITLGKWQLNKDTITNSNTLINIQAGTIMHEFGHNLGLEHGGDVSVNNKPNYLSVMNYLYQLEGLATPGNNEGDRYYESSYAGNTRCITQSMTNNVKGNTADFIIDYSDGSGEAINEYNIDESKGIGREMSDGVDFNCNGSRNDNLSAININGTESVYEGGQWIEKVVLSQLRDHNDWQKISLKFQSSWAGNAGISSFSTFSDQQPQQVDFMLSDQQRLITEKAPSDAFFNRLQED